MLIAVPRTEPTLPDIIDTVAWYYGVTAWEIRSRVRFRERARMRYIVFYLARDMITVPIVTEPWGNRLPLTIIGRMFRMHHTSVAHGVTRLASMLDTDERLRDDIDVLRMHILDTIPESRGVGTASPRGVPAEWYAGNARKYVAQ